MAGYAASSRLQGAVPRFAGRSPIAGGAAGTLALESSGPQPSADPADAPETDQIELVGRPFGDAVRDWLASIGESWSQTTFYLFDPESWR